MEEPAFRPASSTAQVLVGVAEVFDLSDPNGFFGAGQNAGLISGYAVAAKTGTAQVSGPGQSNCLCQYGASYIGIAPADNPQLVVAVNIQDPQGKYYGDQVAGPAFYDVMKFALQSMKIPPDYAKTPYIRLTAP